MTDNTLQTEVLLNMLNTVFAKAVYFKNLELIEKLSLMRHRIYYGNFDYVDNIKTLKEINDNLS